MKVSCTFSFGRVSTEKDMGDLIFGHVSIFRGTLDTSSRKKLSTGALKSSCSHECFTPVTWLALPTK